MIRAIKEKIAQVGKVKNEKSYRSKRNSKKGISMAIKTTIHLLGVNAMDT